VARKGKKKKYFKYIFNVLLLGGIIFAIYYYYPKFKSNVDTLMQKDSLVIKSVIITGCVNTTEDNIRSLVNVKTGDLITSINVKSIEENVKTNPWIANSHVFIDYPNDLKIEVIEKTPVAVVRQGNEKIIVNEKGDLLTKENVEKFKELPVIKSKKENVAEIMEYMKTQPYFYEEWISAELVNNRRWNIIISNGIEVKLPEENVIEALDKLNELRLKGQLFNYDVRSIDMRLSDRITLK